LLQSENHAGFNAEGAMIVNKKFHEVLIPEIERDGEPGAWLQLE
jgi:hypothetical protein